MLRGIQYRIQYWRWAMLMFVVFAVITDPDNPSFDLEKYLDKVSKDNP